MQGEGLLIFVTVGAQMPFDRLVRTVDDWAGATGSADVVAQVGNSTYVPRNLRWEKFLEPSLFEQHISRADVVVGHAGTGTILSALSQQKPILVMPRRASLAETRNDHQTATVNHLRALEGVTVAMDEDELLQKLQRLHTLRPGPPLPDCASSELLSTLRNFLR